MGTGGSKDGAARCEECSSQSRFASRQAIRNWRCQERKRKGSQVTLTDSWMTEEGRRTACEEVESCIIDAPSDGMGMNQEKSRQKIPTKGEVSLHKS